MLTTAKKVADQAGSSIPRVKVPDNGAKTLRILRPLEETPAHFVHFVTIKGTGGSKDQFRSFECMRDEEGNGRCPICEAGDDSSRKRSARIIFFVLDRKPGEGEKTAGVMEMGARFFKDLEAMEEEFGPVTTFDIKVMVQGAGQQRKYSVLPTNKKEPFGPTEQGALDSIDISDLVPADLTYDKMKQAFNNFVRSTTFDPAEFAAEDDGVEGAPGDGSTTDDF